MKTSSKGTIAVVLAVAGLFGAAGQASAAEPHQQAQRGPVKAGVTSLPTCVGVPLFVANVGDGTNSSVIIRNNCAGTIRAQAQYGERTGVGGSTYYSWGPCVTLSSTATWSSPVYWVSNLTGGGTFWVDGGGGEGYARSC